MASDALSIWLNLTIFAGSAALVWAAGTKLAVYVDGISSQTGVGQAFMGMLLLGGITSLPEIATVTTASWTGNAPLAVNNLLGSASINIVLLAAADAAIGRDALTSVVAKSSTLLQGTLGMLLLTGVALAVTVGDVSLLGVGAWSVGLFVACAATLWLSSGYEDRHTWSVVNEQGEPIHAGRQEEDGRGELPPLRSLLVKTGIAAALILVSGFFLSQTGDAIATKTGFSGSIVGFVLVGFATSLPELSSILSAVRIKRYELAVGDIFGTNLFNVALIFLADLAYGGPPVLSEAGPFETVAAMLGVLLTGFFVVGLLERKDQTVLRMGYDALGVLITFAAGLGLLLTISGG